MYTFKAWNDLHSKTKKKNTRREGEHTFEFVTDEQGKPVKLGDGSFGVVYKVKLAYKENYYAVKLFYNRDLDNENEAEVKEQLSEVESRFLLDFGYIDNIKKRWGDSKGLSLDKNSFKPHGVIEPYAATKLFKESVAYKNLFLEGELKNTKVSDFAIVYPLYDGTLKDLLEEKGEGLNTAYKELGKVDFDYRILAMLPILNQVVTGLKTLYIGEYSHLDIKPANIFYSTSGYGEMTFVLADMGYLNLKGVTAPGNRTLHDDDKELQKIRGTRHYRSPEQLDYFDKCDAKVEVEDSNAILKIVDPKFDDTIITKGDILFFSKSSERFIYEIEDIQHRGKAGKFTVIKIKTNGQKEKILPDEKTQVEFRKRQTIKTDLFGVGAIAYDILTGGKSPERFYERIRNLDNKTKSITDIMGRYNRLKAHKTNDHEIYHIFKHMTYGNEYPDAEIVEFILKCMLYNVKEIYGDLSDVVTESHEGENAETHLGELKVEMRPLHTVFDTLKADLNKIRSSITARINEEEPGLVPQKLLLKKNRTLIEGIDSEPKNNSKMSHVLKSQALKDNELFYWRLSIGVKHLTNLIEVIRDIFKNTESKNTFFAELYPSNLSVLDEGKRMLIPDDIAYNERVAYIEDVENDQVLRKLFTDHTNFFVPEYFPNLHRSIELSLIDKTSMEQLVFRYDFLSKSFLGEGLKKGDWVTHHKVGNSYVVESFDIENKTVTLVKRKRSEEKKGKEKETEKKFSNILDVFENKESKDKVGSVEMVYHHNIDRLKYYLELLGIYTQHLFFAGQGNNSKIVPKLIQQIRYKVKTDYEWQDRKDPNPVSEIYCKVAELYARLILVDDAKSFYAQSNGENIEKTFTQIMNETDDIRVMIETTLFKTGRGWVKGTSLKELKTVDKCKAEIKPEIPTFFKSAETDFEKILSRLLLPPPPPVVKPGGNDDPDNSQDNDPKFGPEQRPEKTVLDKVIGWINDKSGAQT